MNKLLLLTTKQSQCGGKEAGDESLCHLCKVQRHSDKNLPSWYKSEWSHCCWGDSHIWKGLLGPIKSCFSGAGSVGLFLGAVCTCL